MESETTRIHTYHGEAYVLDAHLLTPVKARIEPQAQVCLSTSGGYKSEKIGNFHLEGVVSIKSGYSQVSGNPSPKRGHGWVTLATSVLEGLNVLEVVTADRIVAQVSTEHPLKGYIPRITFLGTRFENLRILGHEMNPRLDLDICGEPDDESPYPQSGALQKKAQQQHQSMSKTSDWARERYSSENARLKSMRELELSMITGTAVIPGVNSCGHVIEVPEFGRIILAELIISCYFQLTMLRLELGCIADGVIATGHSSVNGATRP